MELAKVSSSSQAETSGHGKNIPKVVLPKARLKPLETKGGQKTTHGSGHRTPTTTKTSTLPRVKLSPTKPSTRVSFTSDSKSGETTASLDPKSASLPPAKKSGKMLFAGIGKKVTSMVRARMAFASNRGLKDQVMTANTMEQIHEMPKAPRFSSSMSAEAQYAMMMGYEDVLHNQLSKNHPEYRTSLLRSKTPMFNVGIVRMNLGSKNTLAAEPEEVKEVKHDDDDDMWNDDVKEKTNVQESESSSPSIRPRDMPSPQRIPFDRRLHLTYRIESAMDILDTIRRRHGQYPISPRVRSNKREIAPIRDYNSWTNVWKKEFSPCGEKRSQHRKVRV